MKVVNKKRLRDPKDSANLVHMTNDQKAMAITAKSSVSHT
jgi:hypothetical protein